jgi:DNA-binding transcriptional ArsR family regulator
LAILAEAIGHLLVSYNEHLIKVKQLCLRDIVNELPLAQPTVSQHLKELKTPDKGVLKETLFVTASMKKLQ